VAASMRLRVILARSLRRIGQSRRLAVNGESKGDGMGLNVELA
jgi:hypothetical protein